MKKSDLIDFPYLPPTMAKNLEDSVYFWWWAYLKRHEGYIRTCEANGKGDFAKLYEDFGDVRDSDFSAWWESPSPDGWRWAPMTEGQKKLIERGLPDRYIGKGLYLFANPPKKYPFVRVKIPLPEEAYTDPNVLILQVPLDEPKSDLLKRFSAYIDTFKSRQDDDEIDRRGMRAARSSRARYKVIGQPNTKALKKTLMVYDLRKNTDMKLWQIANELEHCKGFYDTSEPADRNTLGVIASRYLKKAEIMIENVGLGRFPDVHPSGYKQKVKSGD